MDLLQIDVAKFNELIQQAQLVQIPFCLLQRWACASATQAKASILGLDANFTQPIDASDDGSPFYFTLDLFRQADLSTSKSV